MAPRNPSDDHPVPRRLGDRAGGGSAVPGKPPMPAGSLDLAALEDILDLSTWAQIEATFAAKPNSSRDPAYRNAGREA